MAGWLNKAVEAFAKKPPPPPETFDVGCDCGGRVTGVRMPAAQKPACPICGQPVFVLPANVYPAPQKPKTKKGDPSGEETKSGTSSTENDTNPGKPSKNGKGGDSNRSNSAVSSARKSSGDSNQFETAPPTDAIALDDRVKLITPFRVIAAVMLVVCSLTAWGLLGRYRIESAKAVVAKATEAGLKAMKEQDYATAALQLERAVRSVDILKRNDDESMLVRRMLREAVAAKGLASTSLVDLTRESLADVRRFEVKSGENTLSQRWESRRFEGLYQNSWVVFDASVFASESPTEPCLVDIPVFHNGQRVRVQVTSKPIWSAAKVALRPLPSEATNSNATASPNEDDASASSSTAVREPASSDETSVNQVPRVIFAAQLDQILPAGASSPEATLILNGKTAFAWTSFETYEALGGVGPDEDEQRIVRAIMERQLEATKDEVTK